MIKDRDMKKDKNTGEMVIKNAFQGVLREIQIMSLIGDGHGSVIKLHEVIDCDAEDKLILVIDFALHGEIMGWDEDELAFETCLE